MSEEEGSLRVDDEQEQFTKDRDTNALSLTIDRMSEEEGFLRFDDEQEQFTKDLDTNAFQLKIGRMSEEEGFQRFDDELEQFTKDLDTNALPLKIDRISEEEGSLRVDDERDQFTKDVDANAIPLKIDWLDLSGYGELNSLGISALPGCRFKGISRCLETDIATVKSNDLEQVFVLCTFHDLTRYRVPKYLEVLAENGLGVYHFPIEDGNVPKNLGEFQKLLDAMSVSLMSHKGLIHCYGGLGRSCMVACCLLMYLDEALASDKAMEIVRAIRGGGGIFSVKQYNFINDYRDKVAQLHHKK